MKNIFEVMTVNGEDYKLKLSVGEILRLEKKYGNILNSFINANNQMPTLGYMLDVLHASFIKYNHGITYDKTVELYSTWVEENHSQTDLLNLLIMIFKVSGIIPYEEDEEVSDIVKEEKK